MQINDDGRAVSGFDVSGGSFSFATEWDMLGVHSFDISVKDRAGNQSSSSNTFRTYSSPLPPDPATVAPEIDRTVVTDLKSATSFLSSGSNPIQIGMSPDIITPVRAAVIRKSPG